MAARLRDRSVLVTGGAGFIGGHLAASLAAENRVTILDDLSTGRRENVPKGVEFVRGSIEDEAILAQATRDVDIVFHQAALPSVARSIEDPKRSHAVNADGTLNVLEAARKANVDRVVYAASSSAYG